MKYRIKEVVYLGYDGTELHFYFPQWRFDWLNFWFNHGTYHRSLITAKRYLELLKTRKKYPYEIYH